MRKLSLLALMLILMLLLSCCSPEPVPGTGEFTYRTSVTEAPVCYSPMDWRTDTEAAVLELTASPLYDAGIENEDYVFLPEMAADVPVDISDGQAGTAWQIDLRTDAVWSDGTPITAETYLRSLRELLDPAAQHTRASDWLFLENAWAWYYGDTSGEVTYRTLADCGYLSVSEAQRQGEEIYIDMNALWGLDCGWQSIGSEELFRDPEIPEGESEDYVSPSYVYNTYLADGAPYAAYQTTFTGVARDPVAKAQWEEVGIEKAGDYRLVLRTAQPMTAAELMQKLSRCFLVPAIYDGAYGMSPEDYLSCGPYTLTSITAETLTFTRNASWYGYADVSYQGQYAATAVSWRILSQEDALAAFEAGELDTVTVTRGENAKAIRQTYTSKLTFNTSFTVLENRQNEGINKTILANRDFRHAISWAINRSAFVSRCVPYASPALGLISDAFVTDIAAGTLYRNTAQAEQVIRAIYGDSDGYDPTLAAKLFQSAYDTAFADGLIGENDTVELEFLVYSDGQVYRDIVDFVQQALNAATVGTSLEGRVKIKRTVEPGYYDAAREGNFDIILSTWGGAAEDPYTILSCYCDREKSYEYGFDPSREGCTLTIDGVEETKSYRGWYDEMASESDSARKLSLLSALERSVLERYDCVPVYERNTLFVDGQRILRPVEEAVPFAEFGGVRYAEFTADDAGNAVEEEA